MIKLTRVFFDQDERTKCKTYFKITGNFQNTEQITEILGIKNTDGHNIGDMSRYLKKPYDWAEWIYGTDYVENAMADQQVIDVIAPLTEKITELLIIKEKFNCQFILMQVPIINKGNQTPIGYSVDVVDFCSRTGTEIQVDMYINPFSEDDADVIVIDESTLDKNNH